MQIKSRYTGAVIFEDDKPTLRETVLNAVAQKIVLAGANLAGANLARANLAGADLAGANLARAYLADADLATTTPTPGAMREAQQTAALNSAQGPQP